MINPCDRRAQNLCGTEVHGYNAIENENGEKFSLFDTISIEKINGEKLCGAIAFISKDYIDVAPFREHIQHVSYENIKRISA